MVGELIIINRGNCFFGNEVVFNSNLTSNLVGLFKPCTLIILDGGELSIGDHTGFSGVSIYCSFKIEIGNYCNFGGNTSIWDTDFHPINYLERRVTIDGAKSKAIKIGDDVFIGANVIILKGVKIGDRSIIGAGSVVTSDIPQDEVWAGNPAKFIKSNLI
jgi:acetyltransferase-like isoleucine patch superfamily enzyme